MHIRSQRIGCMSVLRVFVARKRVNVAHEIGDEAVHVQSGARNQKHKNTKNAHTRTLLLRLNGPRRMPPIRVGVLDNGRDCIPMP